MGAEALYSFSAVSILMRCHILFVTGQNTETSQQRKNEALKRLQVVEASGILSRLTA